jgi:peptidoglycan hydrolase-like protein with peptidoglycan-binding domain
MKPIILFSTMAGIAGLLVVGLALGTGQKESGQSQMGSSSQMQGTQMEESGRTTSATGQTQQQMAAQQLNQQQVRELQNLLQEKGFNVGQVDGIIGPKTRDALRQFQGSEDIASTGNPDNETLRALAPSAEEQEFFGLSPEFGEKEEPMETQPTEKPMETPEGSKY